MAKDRIEVITSVERRRRFSRVEKEHWVAALLVPGANLSEVARRAGIDRTLLCRWRRQLSDAAGPPEGSTTFVPVRIANEDCGRVDEPSARSPPGSITLDFGGRVRARIEGAPDTATLTQIIGALSGSERRR